MKKSVSIHKREFSKQLREQSTPSEKKLWSILRGNKMLGLHVRRQHPIGTYIVDFYIHSVRLVIELDGLSHSFRYEADQARDAYLASKGLIVLRIPSSEVFKNPQGVYEQIEQVCRDRLIAPPQDGEG